jgi:hypothetical protein
MAAYGAMGGMEGMGGMGGMGVVDGKREEERGEWKEEKVD